MIKRSPGSRNHRSKGIKVKHILQVLLLLGVSFWLIYQVKHNHDKKKEFDKSDAKLLVTSQTDHFLKLGRKDLHPGKDEVNQNKKHEEEDEDEHILEEEENKHDPTEQEQGSSHDKQESEENMHEVREQEEEKNKHGAEQEVDENKSEDIEDEEEVGGGDGEIDEHDHEKSEVDTDHDNEIIDEEKEREEEGDEKENEDKEDEEKGVSVENHNNHEAREEHYKGDDASSAVAHDTNATSTESETNNLENADVNLEMNITKPENRRAYSDGSNMDQNDYDSKVTEGEVTAGISSNATAAGKENGNDSLSNTTAKRDTNSDLEVSSNLTVVTTVASNNLTGAGAEQNKIILSESDHGQNTPVNTTTAGEIKNVQTEGLEQSGNRILEEKMPNNDLSVSIKTENVEAAAGKSSTQGPGELEKTIRSVASNETENTFRNLDRNVSSDTSESVKSKGSAETNETNEDENAEDEMFKGDTQTGEPDDTSDSSSAGEILDAVEHDAIDSSDTHIQDVTQVRTDLDTLPDIINEGDETAAV